MKASGKYLLKWFLILLTGSVLSFFLMRMMPVTPVDMYLQAHKLERSSENIAFVTHKLGMDRTLWTQYRIWLQEFLQGDWGVSMVNNVDIKSMFLRKLPFSLCIGMSGIVGGSILAFVIGYFASLREKGIAEWISRFFALFAQSVPSFLTTILIIEFFCVRLKAVRFFTGDGKYALTAACLVSILYTVGSLSRVVRAGFMEEMNKSYFRFYISRGFSQEYVLLLHASRPVVCHLIATIIANFAYILGGSTVLEIAFSIPGVSSFLVSSMNARDYTVMQSYIMIVLIWMFFVHLLLSILLQIIDVRRKVKNAS